MNDLINQLKYQCPTTNHDIKIINYSSNLVDCKLPNDL